MKERVAELVGDRAKLMWVSTFHSACVRILRKEASLLGYTNSFTIYDQSDSLRLITIIMRDLNLDAKRYAPRAVASLISQSKNELLGPADYLNQSKDQFQEIVAQVFAIYQKRLTGANSMDFDDLIAKTVEVLQRHPEVRAKYRSRFKHILVDEYQLSNGNRILLIAEGRLVNLGAAEGSPAAVLEFSLADEEIIARLSSRRTCRDCGASNVGVDKCPTCGGEVYQREDDKAEVITRRLEVYAEQTAPIISFYRNEGLLISVSAVGNVEDITASAISALSRVAQ